MGIHDTSASQTLADRLLATSAENRELRVKNAALERELQSLRAIKKAEDILVKAASSSSSPPPLQVSNLREFLTKRQELAQLGHGEIDKVASSLDFLLSGSIPQLVLSDTPDQDEDDTIFSTVHRNRLAKFG